MKRSVCYILAVCAVLAGCSRVEENGLDSQKEIRFTASVGTYQVKATDTAFESGDTIGVSAFYPVNFTNIKLTYTDGAFQSRKPLYWGRGQGAYDEALFVAYYPFQNGRNFAEGIDFTVQPDQSNHAGYSASDFMSASGMAKPADEVVNLNFSHRLTKIVLHIDDSLEEEISEVYVGNLLGRAKMDPWDMTVTGSLGTIKAGAVDLTEGGEGWVLIAMPQMARPKLMVTTVEGKQYTYTVEEEFELLAGHCHHAHVTIDENSIATDFTSDVTEWVDDSDIQFRRPAGLTHFQEVYDAEDGTVFTVSGTVSRLENINYGNYYIQDEDGNTLYIYGTVDSEGRYPRSTTWYVEPFGFVPGDVVTVTGPKTTYKGQTELVDVQVKEVNRVPFGVLSTSYRRSCEAWTIYVLIRVDDLTKVTVSSILGNWVQVTAFEDAGMPMETWRCLVFEMESNPTYTERRTTIEVKYSEDWNEEPTYRQTIEFYQEGRPVWSVIGDIEGVGWDADIDLKQLPDNTWYGFFYYEQGQQFVLRLNHNWEYSLRLPGDMTSMNDSATLTDDASGGNSIMLPETGIYELFLNEETKVLKVVPMGESWSMIGTIKGSIWDTDYALLPTLVWKNGSPHAAVHYVLDYHQGNEFKFRYGRAWDYNYGGANVSVLIPNVEEDLEPNGANLMLEEEGVYDIHFTFFDKKVMASPSREDPWTN